jgi:hypothetical protein
LGGGGAQIFISPSDFGRGEPKIIKKMAGWEDNSILFYYMGQFLEEKFM